MIAFVFGLCMIMIYSFLIAISAIGVFPFDNNAYNFFVLFALSLFGVWVKVGYSLWKNKKVNVDPFSPEVFFPIALALYYGIGSLRLADYQTWINPEIYNYLLASMISYYGGVYLIDLTSSLGNMSKRKSYCFGFIRRPQMNSSVDFTMSPRAYLSFRTAYFWLLLLCLVAHALIIKSVGILIFRDDFQDARTQVIGSIGGYLYYVALAAIDLIVLAGAVKIVFKKWIIVNKITTISILVLLLILLLQLGSRTRVIYPFFCLFIFYWFYASVIIKTPIKVENFFMVTGAVFVFLILFGAYRYHLSEKVDYDDALIYVMFGELHLVADAFNRLYNTFPDKVPYIGAKFIAAPFLTLLPGKQTAMVDVLKQDLNLDYAGGGFTPSIIGSLYLIDGMVSIVIGMMMWGAVLKSFYLKANATRIIRTTPVNIIIYSFLVVYSFNVMKGGFFKDLEPVFHVLVIYIIFKIAMAGAKRKEVSK